MHTYILIHNINDRLLYFTGAYKESREGPPGLKGRGGGGEGRISKKDNVFMANP